MECPKEWWHPEPAAARARRLAAPATRGDSGGVLRRHGISILSHRARVGKLPPVIVRPPTRFGGGPTDYQLVEQEGRKGQPSLKLLVDPRLGSLDEPAMIETFLTAIGAGSSVSRLMALQWREGDLLRVDGDELRILPLIGRGPKNAFGLDVERRHCRRRSRFSSRWIRLDPIVTLRPKRGIRVHLERRVG